MSLTPADIDAVCSLVMDLCGIYLDDSKGYLIESRLGDLVSRAGCESYAELARQARFGGDGALRNQIVDSITTNETLFFRDTSTFDALTHKVLPELIDSKTGSLFPKRLRIWSAACSTGQEAYSIAMVLSELLPDIHERDVQILGTDVSDDAVARASAGRYAQHEVNRGLTPMQLDKYFDRAGSEWRVKDDLRSLVVFERRNLLDPLPYGRKFDVIFCRNVAIYFTPEARRDLFNRLADCLVPDGYLFVGGQESLSDLGGPFAPHHHCHASFYRPGLSMAAARV